MFMRSSSLDLNKPHSLNKPGNDQHSTLCKWTNTIIKT